MNLIAGRFHLILLGLLFSVGCGTGPANPLVFREPDRTIEVGRQRLAELEESRIFDVEVIEGMLEHPRQELRHEAVKVAGRLRDSRAVGSLTTRLLDGNETRKIRVAAAFALGLIGSSSGLESLLVAIGDDDAAIREEVSRALGRITEEGTRTRVIAALGRALEDSEGSVRGAAALACWHLGEEARRLTGRLQKILADADENPEVRWRVAYALMRIADPSCVPLLRESLLDDSGLVRTYAAWGLRNLEDAGAVAPLAALLSDPSSPWTARVEALRTIGTLREKGKCDLVSSRDVLLEHLIRESHPLCQQVLVESLANGAGEIEVPFLFAMLEEGRSKSLRRGAVVAIARVVGEEALGVLTAFDSDADPWVRVAATVGLRHAGQGGYEALLPLLADEDVRVRTAAVESLIATGGERRWPHLQRMLADSDFAVRATALAVFIEEKPQGWQEVVAGLWPRCLGDEFWEVRTTILEALKDDPRGEMLAKRGRNDRFMTVRRKACEILGEKVPAVEEDGGWRKRFDTSTLSGRGAPRVRLETDRGDVLIECHHEAAERHVSSFLSLVRKGFYDGLIFHRVVPSFVIQGGDPRGDGWGDAGYYIVDEIGRRLYKRGSVGMPKAGDDSGGCQIFITHLPTPHLDSRYTIFAEVLEGLEVVDQIEVGDRIVRATVDERRFRRRASF